MLRAAAAGKEGVPSGVRDLGASRPEVPEGPLWSWRSRAVSPRAVTAPTPRPGPQLAPARPAQGSPVPSRGSGGREDGRGDGGVGGGEGEVSDSRAGSRVRLRSGFGEASRGGAESGRRGVGLEKTGEAKLGGGMMAALGSSGLPKGGD